MNRTILFLAALILLAGNTQAAFRSKKSDKQDPPAALARGITLCW